MTDSLDSLWPALKQTHKHTATDSLSYIHRLTFQNVGLPGHQVELTVQTVIPGHWDGLVGP